MKRYEAYAEEIAQLIATGVLRPGDRLPSVRQVGAQRGLSPATVFQAYYLLENRGLIRVRPRSGYYVCAPAPSLSAPSAGEAVGESTPVAVTDLIFQMLDAMKRPDIVPFGAALPSPELFPLARLSKALMRSQRLLAPSSVIDDMPPGNPELRRLIARRYQLDGIPVGADDIVITHGALEALNLSLQAVTVPGDAVVLETPTFYGALQALERLNLRAIKVPGDPHTGLDPALLEQAVLRQRPKACWLMPNFQHPLGSLMSPDRKRAIVELLARHRIPLIEDDAYGELYYAASRPPPAKAFDRDGWVLHCSSFSKSLAPGYRIGWCAPGLFADRVRRLQAMTTLSAPVPTQAALAEYLEHGGYDRHLRQLRHRLLMQRNAMIQAVERYFPPSTRVSRPEGGYFLWVELPPEVDALALQARALESGISLAPGPMFSATAGFRNCIRLNYGHVWTPRLEDAMAQLGQLVKISTGS